MKQYSKRMLNRNQLAKSIFRTPTADPMEELTPVSTAYSRGKWQGYKTTRQTGHNMTIEACLISKCSPVRQKRYKE